jgi:hypothetical protein
MQGFEMFCNVIEEICGWLRPYPFAIRRFVPSAATEFPHRQLHSWLWVGLNCCVSWVIYTGAAVLTYFIVLGGDPWQRHFTTS